MGRITAESVSHGIGGGLPGYPPPVCSELLSADGKPGRTIYPLPLSLLFSLALPVKDSIQGYSGARQGSDFASFQMDPDSDIESGQGSQRQFEKLIAPLGLSSAGGCAAACHRDQRRAKAYAKFKGKVQDSSTGERDKRLKTLVHE